MKEISVSKEENQIPSYQEERIVIEKRNALISSVINLQDLVGSFKLRIERFLSSDNNFQYSDKVFEFVDLVDPYSTKWERNYQYLSYITDISTLNFLFDECQMILKQLIYILVI